MHRVFISYSGVDVWMLSQKGAVQPALPCMQEGEGGETEMQLISHFSAQWASSSARAGSYYWPGKSPRALSLVVAIPAGPQTALLQPCIRSATGLPAAHHHSLGSQVHSSLQHLSSMPWLLRSPVLPPPPVSWVCASAFTGLAAPLRLASSLLASAMSERLCNLESIFRCVFYLGFPSQK